MNLPVPIIPVTVEGDEKGAEFGLGGVFNSMGRDELGELYVIGQEINPLLPDFIPNTPTGFIKKIVNGSAGPNTASDWKDYE